MTKFYAGLSFPNGLGLTSLVHLFFSLPCQLPSLSSSILGFLLRPTTPELSGSLLPLLFVLCFPLFFSPAHHTHLCLPSLGIQGNFERCRLMTVETWVGRCGLVSGNRPRIQTGTSDILLPDARMSSNQLLSHMNLRKEASCRFSRMCLPSSFILE